MERGGAPRLTSQALSPCLVIIDVQQDMFTCRCPRYRGEEVLERIAGLLENTRDAEVPIFHVQHDGGPGHILAKGSIGWPHHTAIQPRSSEAVIEKLHSSAFQETDFHARLTEAGIDRLAVAGIQTEMCVGPTCRAAVALGYKVILVSDAHSTFDSLRMSPSRVSWGASSVIPVRRCHPGGGGCLASSL